MTQDTELLNLDRLLANCRERQLTLYKTAPDDMPPLHRAAYLRDMVLALHSEADECLRTMVWKPWARRGIGDYAVPVEDRAGEIADVLLFTMNIALALDVSAEELADALNRTVTKVDSRLADPTYAG